MIRTLRQARSFSRPVRLLLVNQVGINIGFYMLMPYLAAHLAGTAGLATWLVGLILGIRNFSQQGMFLIGGTLADRIGYRSMIIAGCGLRVIGFALFAFSTALPALIAAAAITGLAGALFNPAARAYIAREAADREVEAFAVFNVFYQLGILIGPIIGIALLGVDFRVVCLAAGAIFAVLTVLQVTYLPARRGTAAGPAQPLLTDWRQAIGNRPFMGFAAAMFASYALSFQVYLGLPLEVERLTAGQGGVVAVFAVQAALALAGQVRLTEWCRARWSPGQAITRGLAVMAVAFLPLALVSTQAPGGRWQLAPILVSAALLGLGTMLVFPFEMALITTLGPGRLLGTYYGLYNLLSGVGILIGNLVAGSAMDLSRSIGLPMLPWLVLMAIGGLSATAVRALDHRVRLTAPEARGRRERSPVG
ncbi:MFS transporter [Actinomadura rugatobispora]|uniref:MFS transporter n=1 Tax=Actinomadura rugatobispora TaxID=1994 RepID=A0ABW1AF46_9ACTN|nr:MFS transporter [Actinomadura rugatobispora]